MFPKLTLPIVSPPVIQPIVETFTKENIIAKDAVLLILKILLVIALSLIVGLLLCRRMERRFFRTNRTVILLLTTAMAIALSLRFGLSVYTFQGLFLYFLLLYASLSDLTDRQVADHVSISLLALSLISVPTVGILSMVIGGVVSAAIQIGVSMFSGGRYGGADWKISSACVFLLGWWRGFVGLGIGLLVGILFTLIRNKLKKRTTEEGIALVPFISLGMMGMFFV